MEPASPSAYVSAILSLMNKEIKSLKKKKKRKGAQQLASPEILKDKELQPTGHEMKCGPDFYHVLEMSHTLIHCGRDRGLVQQPWKQCGGP